MQVLDVVVIGMLALALVNRLWENSVTAFLVILFNTLIYFCLENVCSFNPTYIILFSDISVIIALMIRNMGGLNALKKSINKNLYKSPN